MAETQLKAESSGLAAPPVVVEEASSETTTVVEESKSNVAVAEPESEF
jgi:hypothetical protein